MCVYCTFDDLQLPLADLGDVLGNVGEVLLLGVVRGSCHGNTTSCSDSAARKVVIWGMWYNDTAH